MLRYQLLFILCVLLCGVPILTQNLRSSLTSVSQSTPTQSTVNALIEPFFLGVQTSTNPLNCLFCLVLVNAIEQYSQKKHKKVDSFILHKYCNLFDNSYQEGCRTLIAKNGPKLIQILKNTTNPDQVCRQLSFCTSPQCSLYPQSYAPALSFSRRSTAPINGTPAFPVTPTFTDGDKDHFSAQTAIKGGFNWKGKDCDENDNSTYPGRKADPYPGQATDYNCNGIQGVDCSTGRPLKDVICEDTQQLGTVVSGDSIGSRYNLQLKWFDQSQWRRGVFTNLPLHAPDVFSTPQYSAFTGTCPNDDKTMKPCRSFYKYFSQWNKCNTNDYINIAVSGATLKSTLTSIKAFTRDKVLDYPVIMFLEVLVNDICRVVTTPESFRADFTTLLAYLDTVLPQGSHLVVLGLFEHDFYGPMLNKAHPSGFTYADLYTFASCSGVPLCPGLLNSNATQRQIRLQQAHGLNQVYKDVLSTQATNNFDSAYYDFPSQYIIDKFAAEGRDETEIIDPVDGFHLSQRTQAVLADYLWETVRKDHSDWIGKSTPKRHR